MSLLKDAHFYTTLPGGVLARHGGASSTSRSARRSPASSRACGTGAPSSTTTSRPPEYFVGVNARVADRCRRGRWELARLRNVTELALGRLRVQPAGARGRRLPADRASCRSWSTGTSTPIRRCRALEEAYGRGTTLLFVGPARPEQARGGPDQGLLLLPPARPGQPADRRRLGGGHRGLPGRLPEALRRARASSTTWCSRAPCRRPSSAPTTASPRPTCASPSTRASACRSSRRCTSTCRWSRTPPPACRAPWATPGSWSRRRTSRRSPSCSTGSFATPPLRAAVVAGQRARLRAFDAETIGATLREHLETLAGAEALR